MNHPISSSSGVAAALDQAAILAMTDADGRILYCNEKFSEVSGYDRGELIGRTHRIVNSGTHDRAFFEDMYGTIRSGRTWRGTICNRNKSGALYWVDTTIVPTLGADGRPVAFTAVRFEVTDHIRALEELKRARLETERAAEARERFFATMSHEVRTPLNGILGLTSALERTDLNSHQTELLGLVTKSGESLCRILDDVLDASRIRAGAVGLTPTAFDLKEEIRACLALMQPLATEGGVNIGQDLRGEDGIQIVTDRVRLRQILTNLVSNAIKFAPGGTVTVHAALKRREEAARLRLVVQDTGIGFDRRVTGDLFEPFRQADETISRRFGGTGLGLAICRSLVELMGGTIRCHSRPGRGSLFSVSLPVTLTAAEPRKAAPAPDLDPALKLLLVEDNETNRLVVRCLLEPFGIDLAEAGDGEEALRLLSTGYRPHAILMDMQMPVMDGLTAVAAIRRREGESRDPRTPIAMFTANTSDFHIRQSLLAGADLVITKPVTSRSLTDGLQDLLAVDAEQAPPVAETSSRPMEPADRTMGCR